MSINFITSVTISVEIDTGVVHHGIKEGLHHLELNNVLSDIMWRAKDTGYLLLDTDKETAISIPFEKISIVRVSVSSTETVDEDSV